MKKKVSKLVTTWEEIEIGTTNAGKFFIDQVPILGSFIQRIDAVNQGIEIKYMQKYLIELSEYLESRSIQEGTLDRMNEYFNSEDGQEYISLTIEKSKKIRTSDKREYLRNLFLNHSSSPKPMNLDNAERYLKTIEDLETESVLILKFQESFTYKNAPKQGHSDSGKITDKVNEDGYINYLEAVSKQLGIEIEDLSYYHQQLLTHGLLIDDGIGKVGATALQMFKITKRGKLFLNFIKKPVQTSLAHESL